MFTTKKKVLINDLGGDYKAGILHDGSSIETGEASIFPPVNAIRKKVIPTICKEVLLEIKVLRRPS